PDVSPPPMVPAVDPIQAPIEQPVPAGYPQPLPRRSIPARVRNPWRSPTEQSQFGYEIPGQRPRSNEEGNIEFDPNGGTKPTPQHRLEPAPKGTKERKFIANVPSRSAL